MIVSNDIKDRSVETVKDDYTHKKKEKVYRKNPKERLTKKKKTKTENLK